ncbi:signal transduction histidine kinase [Lentzea atacamensis]|uniref:histidine kinase n=2 Tax=Lentzea TaxID=165301 RepID=A0A316HNI1_9PSEU|nr:HAMP domain-containing sensor histidine kinase [Lentzea atacamensis]PWK82813.1 signal transduction histidine kinase [Lentzea atacamensis]
MPARVKIMCWLLGLMTLVLATVVVVVWRFLLVDVEDRVNRALEQETTEFSTYAETHPGDTRTVAEAHLRLQYPDEHEAHFAVFPAGKVLVQRSEVTYALENDRAVLGTITSASAPWGVASTPAGPFRWAKVHATAGGSDMWFVTGYFEDGVLAPVHSTLRVLVLVSLAGLLIAALIAWFVAGVILAPVRMVRQAAAEITEDDLTRRIPVSGNDDVAALAQQFNSMLDRLERSFRLQRQFLDDASHELRTPITIVRGHLELLGDDPSERAAVVRLCTDELDRMARLVEDLLLLVKSERPDFLRPVPTSLPELTSDIDAKLRALGDRRWVLESIAEGEAVLDPQRVTQALVQLASNAVKHTSRGSTIRFGSSVDGVVSFWVADSGPGVRDESLLFSRSTGLGLPIVKAIAEAHGGRVQVLSVPGEGATFVVEVPR